MRALHCPIEHALDAEDIGNLRFYRRLEGPAPLPGGGLRFESIGFNVFVGSNFFLIFRTRSSIFSRNFQQHTRITLTANHDFLFKSDRRSIRCYGVRTRR